VSSAQPSIYSLSIIFHHLRFVHLTFLNIFNPISFFRDQFFLTSSSFRSFTMSWNNPEVTTAEGTTDAWGNPVAADAPATDAWGASGDAGDAGGEGEAESEAPRPSYQPVGITKTPGEHGWANKKDAAYDYDTFNKSSKELADALVASTGGEGEAAADVTTPDVEVVGAVGGLAPGQWASNAAVYNWDQEYGDVGPRFADLEKQLFGSEFHVKAGIQFDQ
jgi:hypothetical protein